MSIALRAVCELLYVFTWFQSRCYIGYLSGDLMFLVYQSVCVAIGTTVIGANQVVKASFASAEAHRWKLCAQVAVRVVIYPLCVLSNSVWGASLCFQGGLVISLHVREVSTWRFLFDFSFVSVEPYSQRYVYVFMQRGALRSELVVHRAAIYRAIKVGRRHLNLRVGSAR